MELAITLQEFLNIILQFPYLYMKISNFHIIIKIMYKINTFE